jgi:hypothetical protein
MIRRLIVLVVALLALAAAAGCYYSGATFNAKNGKIYITRNDGFLAGALRKAYECTPAGESYNCQLIPDAP